MPILRIKNGPQRGLEVELKETPDKDKWKLLRIKVRYLKALRRIPEARQVIELMRKTCKEASVVNAERELNTLAAGDPSWNFTAITTSGQKISQDMFKGKVAILHYWSTWSESGVDQTKEIKKLFRKTEFFRRNQEYGNVII